MRLASHFGEKRLFPAFLTTAAVAAGYRRLRPTLADLTGNLPALRHVFPEMAPVVQTAAGRCLHIQPRRPVLRGRPYRSVARTLSRTYGRNHGRGG